MRDLVKSLSDYEIHVDELLSVLQPLQYGPISVNADHASSISRPRKAKDDPPALHGRRWHCHRGQQRAEAKPCGSLEASNILSVWGRPIFVAPTVDADPVRSKGCAGDGMILAKDKEDESIPLQAWSNRHRPRLRCYPRLSWQDRYVQLQAFHQRYGHFSVRASDQEFPGLAAWVKRTRFQYKLKLAGKSTSLTNERQSALDTLGFVFDAHQEAWEEQFRALLVFFQLHGHCNVPGVYKENPTLGGWVKGQRRAYKQMKAGQKSSLTPARIQRLEGIGFQWVVRPT